MPTTPNAARKGTSRHDTRSRAGAGAAPPASRQAADDLLARALASGGKPWMPAQDHGFMSGVSFTDPDGHVWEVVWMDPAAVQ